MTRPAPANRRPSDPNLDEVREILVLRALALGDLLCAVPFLRALRRRFPAARVTLMGLPWAARFVDRYPAYLDAFVPFPGWPGIPEVPLDPARVVAFLERAQAHPVDLAIQAHGTGLDLNAFVALLGARTTAGHALPGRVPPSGRWIPYPGDEPEVRRHLALAAALDADPADVANTALEWRVTESDRVEAARAVAPDRLEPGSYAVIHPGASEAIRRWPGASFARVADDLARRGLRIVLTGIAAEAADTGAVAAGMAAPAIDLAGRTSLDGLGALVADARIVISNDTGLAHLADAVGTPSIRIFRASDPHRWAALDTTRHVAVVPPGIGPSCRRAGEPGHGDCAATRCLQTGAEPAPSPEPASADAVLAAVDSLLARPEARVA